MRILHIAHQYLPDHVGGVEHTTRALALAQLQAGHEVALFCRQSGPGRGLEGDILEGLTVYRARHGQFTPAGRFRSTLSDPFLARCLLQAVRDSRPDVIHVQHLMGLPVGAMAAVARAARAPLVVTLHDYWWLCANGNLLTDDRQQACDGPRGWVNCGRCGLARFRQSQGSTQDLPEGAAANRTRHCGAAKATLAVPAAAPFALRAALLRRLARQVAAWIAPTAFVACWHLDHALPARPERMHVVPHGVEAPPGLRRTDREPAGAPPQHAEGMRRLHLAYVGGLAPQKGVHVLIEAFNGLPDAARLTVAGDENSFPDYCARLRSLARHPGIRFAGRLDSAQVWPLLAGVDAVVVPSLSFETASLLILEAFAVGTPVVASAHGALAERVRPEVDGLLFPPGDAAALRAALLRLAGEPGLPGRLRRGVGPVPTPAASTAQVEAVYRQVTAVPTGRASHTVPSALGDPGAACTAGQASDGDLATEAACGTMDARARQSVLPAGDDR